MGFISFSVSSFWCGSLPSDIEFRLLMFVVFKSEYSRMTWLDQWKNVQNTKFQPFYFETCNFVGVSYTLHTCNACDYLLIVFHNFMNLTLILLFLHLSRKQLVERKHQQLLEVADTILFNMDVPVYCWRDALIVACNLINCIPSFCAKQINLRVVLFLNETLTNPHLLALNNKSSCSLFPNDRSLYHKHTWILFWSRWDYRVNCQTDGALLTSKIG